MASQQRISRVFGAVNIGSFRVSAIIAGITENGEMIVLGSGHRAAQGIKRGHIVDMASATYAIRDAVERAEKLAETGVSSVWIGFSGAGMDSHIDQAEIEIGGRKIEDDDIRHLLDAAREALEPDGRTVLHAQPAFYTIDRLHGVSHPAGLHAERLSVDVHVMLADGAPLRNIREAVQSAHLDVNGIIASPLATGYACLTVEERDLGVALVELGAEVTNVAVYVGGMLVGLRSIPIGSTDITDAIASSFGIRRFQAERLKCVFGSAIASPTDHREMIPVNGPGEDRIGPIARGADDKNRIPRSELISVVTGQLDKLMTEVGRSLQAMGFSGPQGQLVVLTGGGAELAGLADYAQSSLGCPVRIGKPPQLRGLPEAHSTPGFATLVGLVCYAVEGPADIRTMSLRAGDHAGTGLWGLLRRVWIAMKEYF
ncbi:cell division protein FtsA [Altericroceibacterium spongiae]|uniref:Cell division protein FtsA n=1 Tax=Altericroceibacterium spongiae TaxID=2320269 RepID=A0A420EKF1_9SPHN|nr:cell division protein FtsA [Altericroceibacterium spongiae]RKF21211.1 cell division protein FtsA [Altericroceibacterium spongiae]